MTSSLLYIVSTLAPSFLSMVVGFGAVWLLSREFHWTHSMFALLAISAVNVLSFLCGGFVLFSIYFSDLLKVDLDLYFVYSIRSFYPFIGSTLFLVFIVLLTRDLLLGSFRRRSIT